MLTNEATLDALEKEVDREAIAHRRLRHEHLRSEFCTWSAARTFVISREGAGNYLIARNFRHVCTAIMLVIGLRSG